jgi:hypothetical protein
MIFKNSFSSMGEALLLEAEGQREIRLALQELTVRAFRGIRALLSKRGVAAKESAGLMAGRNDH